MLLRMAAGDQWAFADFVALHSGSLYSYIIKITKSDYWAEELVQDVWLRVWEARAEFALLENPIGYLHRMAQNRSLDWIRKHHRQLKAQYIISQQLSDADNRVNHSDSIIEQADYERTKRLLEEAIADLPAQRKRIFELRQKNLSYEQIAVKLDISKNTVRNQMVHALQALRTYLQKHTPHLFLFFSLIG